MHHLRQLTFWNLILAGELFAKIFTNPWNCVLVNNNLCGKLCSSLESPTTLDERCKATSVLLYYKVTFLFFVSDFSQLRCDLDNFTFKMLYWVILKWYYIKIKKNYHTLTFPFEKSKMVSFASSIRKYCCIILF